MFCWKVLSFDYSLAQLNDMTDYRMISPEKYALINIRDVNTALECAVRKNPSSPFPNLSASDFYLARGEKDQAEKMIREAIRKDPCSAAYWMRLYRFLRMEYRFSEAETALERAISLFPMNPEYQNLRDKK